LTDHEIWTNNVFPTLAVLEWITHEKSQLFVMQQTRSMIEVINHTPRRDFQGCGRTGMPIIHNGITVSVCWLFVFLYVARSHTEVSVLLLLFLLVPDVDSYLNETVNVYRVHLTGMFHRRIINYMLTSMIFKLPRKENLANLRKWSDIMHHEKRYFSTSFAMKLVR
jgi:hypothetical protein